MRAFNELEKLLEPMSVEDFLASSWGKSFRHVRGQSGKFSNLLPWDQLNLILRQHRLDFPRLRLMQDGVRVPVDSYLRHTTGKQSQKPIPRLKPTQLIKHLRDGATLVLDAVDELHEPLEELAQNLELVFHERIQINMYAGWQTSRGFDLHWDDHDVFILQVFGRKRWRIYGETKPHPLSGDNAVPKPTGEPLWEETLEDGDFLYIPRGWWHVALPLSEPTLHLTVGIHNRTGVDMARWLTERLKESGNFRRDLPRFSSCEERRAQAENLFEELAAKWKTNLIEKYFEDWDATAQPRARLSLPWSVTPEILSPQHDALVRWLAPRPVELRATNGVVEFSSMKKRWRFKEDALLILRPLEERRVCSVAELCEAASGRVDEKRVRKFLGELILEGLVAIVKG
ncbi:MAG: hypothetical protein AUG51_21000 [Acidobacteria bacterium 13_1_20CM_3_53_8]|nr:MAG: hypothetical protein AUG51_21000 [Acidobacteria bacterium 13_1_20CM_3_53_8]